MLFAFDMKLTLSARKNYQELNTTEENYDEKSGTGINFFLIGILRVNYSNVSIYVEENGACNQT